MGDWKNWLTNEMVQRVEGFSGTGFVFLQLARHELSSA